MSLPGHILSRNPDECCDACLGVDKEVPAVIAIQGETDSFGYETLYFCQEHYDEFKEEAAKPYVNTCDRCGDEAELSHWRDPDEGMSGSISELCSNCLAAAKKYYVDNGYYD